MNNALFTRDSIKHQPTDFRIGAIVSDGMWYSLPKWRKLAKVSEEEINAWIEQKLEEGKLLQSPTGAKSYRFPLESIYEWYNEQNITIGTQLIDSIFPPRIWDDMTETEGFLSAPLRKIGIVSFQCNSEAAYEVTKNLRGVARVRETDPGRYKAYCLNSAYVKEIIDDVLKGYDLGEANKKIYSRTESKRREIVDFTPDYAQGLVMFYKQFAKTLVKKDMETIQIFIPDAEDQDSQILIWVITAIEKFDESASVPFSGYLNTVLNRWPFDLPSSHLGKELSSFQRNRSRAINAMKKRFGDEKNFTHIELATEMGMEQLKFNDLEEKHKVWNSTRSATTITWTDNADEKSIESNISGNLHTSSASDIALANKLSTSVIQAALNTGLYDDAFAIISQIDSSDDINMSAIDTVSQKFIQELGFELGSIQGD